MCNGNECSATIAWSFARNEGGPRAGDILNCCSVSVDALRRQLYNVNLHSNCVDDVIVSQAYGIWHRDRLFPRSLRKVTCPVPPTRR